MPESTWTSWQDSLRSLRNLTDVPAALVNATTLMAARRRWSQHLVAHTTAGHDLLFTLPGAKHPFTSQVKLQWAAGISTIRRRQNELLVEELIVESDTVDSKLDSILERLALPALICLSCTNLVTATLEQFEVFERMHYSCFHYEFEHYPFDRDQECDTTGCPLESTAPAHIPEEPRDSLVEELIDALITSDLGEQTLDVKIDREGPGIIRAKFDADTFLVTVRTQPPTH